MLKSNISAVLRAGVIGLAFRVQDGQNYYYATADRTVGAFRAGIVTAGVGYASAYTSSKWPSSAYKTGQYFELSIEITAAGFVFYVCNGFYLGTASV